MKICEVEAKLFHADGQTDRQTDRHDEALTVAFHNFVNAPNTNKRFKNQHHHNG